jgi:hypoxanthine phosphoribosyltransferase
MGHRVYISADKIKTKVKELAAELEKFIGDDEAVLIANLKGSVVFFADIIREIKSERIMLDFLSTESYVNNESSGAVKITRDLSLEISGKKVVLIEDILDTGLTLDHIIRYIRDIHEPSQMKVCVLLDKPQNRKIELEADFVGFTIENEFVIGYGLDNNEYSRNLPYIAVLKQ